jgi:hypothetical protein
VLGEAVITGKGFTVTVIVVSSLHPLAGLVPTTVKVVVVVTLVVTGLPVVGVVAPPDQE